MGSIQTSSNNVNILFGSQSCEIHHIHVQTIPNNIYILLVLRLFHQHLDLHVKYITCRQSHHKISNNIHILLAVRLSVSSTPGYSCEIHHIHVRVSLSLGKGKGGNCCRRQQASREAVSGGWVREGGVPPPALGGFGGPPPKFL